MAAAGPATSLLCSCGLHTALQVPAVQVAAGSGAQKTIGLQKWEGSMVTADLLTSGA